jgi:Na+:H+ antiporter, NhaA family
VKDFLKQESASGFILIGAAVAGLVWANSPWHGAYEALLHAKIGITGAFAGGHLTTHEWVNDGLMAVFFLLIGLEIKRELLGGELSSVSRAALPAIAALGGIIVPSLICFAFVAHDPARVKGWAIPAATDIAFALAVLTMVGRAVSGSLKVFLTALAVIDDLAAIVIIAVFYTAQLIVPALLAAIGCFALLVLLNRLRVQTIPVYLVIGALMWFFVLESGVHATLAGVALALTIPTSGSQHLEHRLHPFTALVIVPVFGLFNAGVSFAGVHPGVLLGALPLGVAAGLFVGKQAGIFAFSWLTVKLGIAPLPRGATWPMIYGLALLGGIGFTMSLFIGSLAFESNALLTETKIGVFAGSILAALAGYIVLRVAERGAGPAGLGDAVLEAS